MNKIKRNSLYIIILFIAILSIVFAFVYKKINSNNKDKSLYNIGNLQEINKDINSSGVAIFDEYVLENFSGIEIQTDNSKVYRADNVIEGTNDNDATETANVLLNLLNNSKIEDNINDSKSFDSIKKNIFNGKINNLNINYFNNVNKSSEASKNTINYLNNYLKNKAVKVESSGYLLNFYDGFESLFNVNNFNNINWDFLGSKINNNSSKIPGLKFVDSRYFYIATYLDKLYDLDKSNFNSALLTINNTNYRANLSKFSTYKNGNIVIFKMSDGIEKFLDNRFFDMNINFGFSKGYKIPKQALIKIDNVLGVFYLDNKEKVRFTPVSLIQEFEKEVYISNNINDIFPSIISESKIEFEILKPFTKILLNPQNYKEGDKY